MKHPVTQTETYLSTEHANRSDCSLINSDAMCQKKKKKKKKREREKRKTKREKEFQSSQARRVRNQINSRSLEGPILSARCQLLRGKFPRDSSLERPYQSDSPSTRSRVTVRVPCRLICPVSRADKLPEAWPASIHVCRTCRSK